jgi:hypothetical protein
MVHHHIERRIGQAQRHMRTTHDADFLQAGGGTVDQPVKLGVARAPAHEIQRRTGAELPGRGAHHRVAGRDRRVETGVARHGGIRTVH